MASSSPPDSADSTFKRRARRRLIGSIALVLVAVITLPWIFDAEKKPLDQDVSVQIPSQDAVTVRPPAAGSAKPKSVEPREPKAPPSSAVEREVGRPSSQVASGTAAKAEAKPEPKVEQKADSKAAAKADPKVASKPDPKPEPAPAVPRSEEARVKAILDNKAAASAATMDAGGFAVQIGAFASEEKVREARDKLAVAGFKSYTEKLESKEGERTRVRAGPFAGREAAEAARAKISTLGFSSAAVVPR